MRRLAATVRSPRARRRGGIAVAVLVGYLLALGGTSVGQGWQLLAHLAHAHPPAPPTVPELYVEMPAAPRTAMTTLRPREAHSHGHGHNHDHGHEHGLRHGAETHRHPAAPALPDAGRFIRAAVPPADGAHEHDGYVHTHEVPEPDPSLVLIAGLDKHQLPTALVLPLPPPPRDLDALQPEAAPRRVETLVETPPPRARG